MRSALLTTLYLLSVSASAETLVGKVVSVPDGNTIIVLDADYLRRKVTFKSIRAPQRNDVFAERAKQYLSALVYGKRVRVDWDTWDRYGRMVGRVLVEEKDVALALLRSGLATVLNSNLANEVSSQREQYLAAEQEASRERLNLWGVAPLGPSPPSRNQQPGDAVPISGPTSPK